MLMMLTPSARFLKTYCSMVVSELMDPRWTVAANILATSSSYTDSSEYWLVLVMIFGVKYDGNRGKKDVDRWLKGSYLEFEYGIISTRHDERDFKGFFNERDVALVSNTSNHINIDENIFIEGL